MAEFVEMESKRVGVFMRVYRNEETMHEAIQSVLNQTYKNLRYYILVNDITKHVIQQYVEKDSRVKVIEGTSNSGFVTYAKKIAEENDYVTTIDADDWYHESYLEDLIKTAETKEAEIVACGNFYFVGKNEIVGERTQKDIVWNAENTNRVLPFVYGHFRTIWGKLISSEVLKKADFSLLPTSDQYGGYGGDTMFMINLFRFAKKLCITEKTLYYYRMSESSATYRLYPGRLESDELVFRFVESVLQSLGAVGEPQRRFLLWVYGNALIDTTRLLLCSDIPNEDKIDKLLYVFQKKLSKELFLRESLGQLEISELGFNKTYANELYKQFFSHLFVNKTVQNTGESYYQIFNILWPNQKGQLSEVEFYILLKSKKLLDAYLAKQFSMLFEMLLVLLHTFDEKEMDVSLGLMRKITSNVIIKNALRRAEFVNHYKELLKMINKKEYDKALNVFHEYFFKDSFPDMAEELVDLWSNLAAFIENGDEFILAKQCKIELLFKLGKIVVAKAEFDELKSLGVKDQNMDILESIFDSSAL